MPSKSAKDGLGCVVLAAGASTRLGRSKQLVRLRGQTLLARTVRVAAAAAPTATVVVLGADQFRLRALLGRERLRPRVVRNPRWRSGLASSLRCGLDALPSRARAALILLPDQARITSAEIDRLTRTWRQHPRKAVAATYAGRAGAPAILPRRWFPAARALEGDVGARHLLRSLEDVRVVTIANAAFDVDTPADLAALKQD